MGWAHRDHSSFLPSWKRGAEATRVLHHGDLEPAEVLVSADSKPPGFRERLALRSLLWPSPV